MATSNVDRDEQAIRRFESGSNGDEDFSPSLVTVSLADVEPKAIDWLWPGKFALGSLAFMAGNPGVGKSMATTSLASIVSNGGTWPVDATRAPQGDVLLLTAEDDIENTIRPRLDAAGGDPSRVFVITMARDRLNGRQIERFPSIVRDIELLAAELRKRPQCKLVIVDPISAYLDGTDSHKNAEVRGALAPLAALARKHNVAIICVTHLNKSTDGEAIFRSIGSIGFIAIARSAFLVAKDPEDARRRVFLSIKNNQADDQTGLAYSIQTNEGGIPFVQWEQTAVTMSADDALSQAPGRDAPALQAACDFLRELLLKGPMTAKELKHAAHEAGLAMATVHRAKDRLGVKSIPTGHGKGAIYIWRLPSFSSESEVLVSPEMRSMQNVEKHGVVEVEV